MKLRISVLTAVVVVLGAGLVGPAGAAVIEGDEEMTTEDAVATEEVPSQVEWHCGGRSSPPVEEAAALAASRVERTASADDEGCSSWYGCRRLDVARVQRTFLGLGIAFKFWHWKRWCWDYPTVWVTGMGTYITNVDPNMHYRGVVNAWDHHDTWCCFSRTSGHLSFRQGRFDNCVLRYGCIGTWYPWVRIHAHGDGSYHYRTGS